MTDLISDYLELASRALRLVTWLFATHLRANIGIYIADVRKKKETASMSSRSVDWKKHWQWSSMEEILIMMIVKVKMWVAHSCLTLCNPTDCIPPVSSIHWIIQARILAWSAFSFFTGSSLSRDWIQVFCIAGRLLTIWVTRKVHSIRLSDTE